MNVFSETKIPSRNLRSSLVPIVQTWLTLAHASERDALSIPSNTSSSLTSLLNTTLHPAGNWTKWDCFPPKKFFTSICFWSFEITQLIGKCACTSQISANKQINNIQNQLVQLKNDDDEDYSNKFLAESIAEAEKEVAASHGRPMDLSQQIKTLEDQSNVKVLKSDGDINEQKKIQALSQ